MKKIIYISTMIFALTLLSACSEDWLELKPTKAIDAEDAFSTPEAIDASVIGIYSKFQSPKGFQTATIAAAELRADDVILKQRNNWSKFVDYYNYSYTPNSDDLFGANGIFLNLYEVIESCNSILDVEELGKLSIDESVKNPKIAEVKTIRALSYFYLVRAFCLPYNKDNGASPGIPLKKESDVSVEKGRGTVKEVYDFIISDLEFANQYLAVAKSPDRIGLTFAQGLLARVYMTMGDNDNAIKYAELALESAPVLSPDFYTSGVSQNNPSSIFELTYTTNTYSYYWSYCSFHDYGWQDAGGYGNIGANEEFYKNYEENDLRQSWFINRWVYENKVYVGKPRLETWYADIRDKIKVGSDPAFYKKISEAGIVPKGLWDESLGGVSEDNLKKLDRQMFDSEFYKTISMYGKFPRRDAIKAGQDAPTTNAGSPNLGNVPLMRTPELYLIIAECSALKGDNAKAKTYLQQIQSNANATVFSGTDADLLEAIKMERRKELVGEGFRMFDIIRRGETINRPKYWGASEYATINPTDANSKVYFPIPQSEIDANSAISQENQNDAYK